MSEDTNVTDAVLRALSTASGTPTDELAHTLRTEEVWPFDSLVLAEVLVQVEEELGVTVPMDNDTARALRSVNGLIDRLSQLAEVPA